MAKRSFQPSVFPSKKVKQTRGVIRPVTGDSAAGEAVRDLFYREGMGHLVGYDVQPTLAYVGPDGKVRGGVAAGLRGDWEGETLAVALDPAARGRGVGRQLVKAQLRRTPRRWYRVTTDDPKMKGVLASFGLREDDYWPAMVGYPDRKRLTAQRRRSQDFARGYGDGHLDHPPGRTRAYLEGWAESRTDRGLVPLYDLRVEQGVSRGMTWFKLGLEHGAADAFSRFNHPEYLRGFRAGVRISDRRARR